MRGILVIAGVVVVAALLIVVVSKQPQLRRSAADRDLCDTERHEDTAARGADPAGTSARTLRVFLEAPQGTAYRPVRLLIADPHRVLAVRHAVPNGAPGVLNDPPSGVLVAGPAFSPEFARAFEDLGTLRWPRPVRVNVREGVPIGAVRLRFETATAGDASVRVRALLDDGAPVFGLVCRLDQLSHATRVRFPMAMLAVEGREVLRGALEAGTNAVTVVASPVDCVLTSREEYRFIARRGHETSLRFKFSRAGTLSGQVVLTTTGECQSSPVGIYHIQSDGRFRPFGGVDTDEEGAFRVEGMPAGRYQVTSWPAGHKFATEVVHVWAARHVHVELHPAGGGSALSGTLVDETDAPIPGVRLNLNPALGPGEPPRGKPIRTNASGGFSWDGLEPGSYLVIAWDLGLMRRVTIDRESPASQRVRWRIPPTQRLRLHTVVGTVRDQNGSTVPSGAWACLERRSVSPDDGWFRFARTAKGGRFSIAGVSPGRYRVWVEPGPVVGGFERHFEPLDVTDGNVELDLRLPSG
jgi:hypothetical protein